MADPNRGIERGRTRQASVSTGYTAGSGFDFKASSVGLRATSMMVGAIGEYSASETAGKMSVADASWRRYQAGREADLLTENAKARIAAGTREASEIQYQGRVAESDAIAAMAAQGGTTDPVMLAKIKQTRDFNSLNALFSATSDARSMRREAFNRKSAGEMGYVRAKTQEKVNRYAARNNLIQSGLQTASMFIGMGA